MTDIIKTWPAFMERDKVIRIFTHDWNNARRYFFSVGRGKPKQKIRHIWFTHQGRILGASKIERLIQNVGDLPPLRSLDNKNSLWQFKPDIWVAVCIGPFVELHDRLYHDSFRGWHYFNLEQYRNTSESRIAL